ncbi:MAG: hypothetical protein JOZ51_13890, partial [Chloroflexi bacterium]|nr:hypothetical protein [Chloroflexota bacterium]
MTRGEPQLSHAAYGDAEFVSPPNPQLAAQAHVGDYQALYQRSLQEPELFWRE